jgi:hypothetical protein
VTDAVKGARFPAPPPFPTFIPKVRCREHCNVCRTDSRGRGGEADNPVASVMQEGEVYPTEICAPATDQDPLTPPDGTDED